jgi:hypothetical protein
MTIYIPLGADNPDADPQPPSGPSYLLPISDKSSTKEKIGDVVKAIVKAKRIVVVAGQQSTEICMRFVAY